MQQSVRVIESNDSIVWKKTGGVVSIQTYDLNSIRQIRMKYIGSKLQHVAFA